ncbi:MAG TPA: TFIIB-type zinc ribbon-containing protein [Nitrosopumilaceae archaeon]|nr:TFIIB-type zinc ribbon-containing protein [Nitrosopumilaceae archaeon]
MVKDNFNNESTCTRCGKHSMLTDVDTGEQYCAKCGYVVSGKSSESGPEWRSFQKDGGADPSRTGTPTSLTRHDKGLYTIISPSNRDSSGKPLSSSMKVTIERLRTWDSRSQVQSSDRNLRQALGELGTLKDKLTISSSVLEKAAYIYRKALEKKLIRGRSISAMIAASLYAACRDTETPRTLNDVASAANVKRKDIARSYRLLYHELELKMPVVDSIQCIARISSKLEITEKIKRYAIEVLKDAQESKESAGKAPMGLAATALYLSCIKNGLSITQRDLADAAGVTEVTIRNRYKGLKAEQSAKLGF